MEWTNYEMRFERKGYGRIFVEKEEDIEKVENIMKEIDEYEFEGYYPRGDNPYCANDKKYRRLVTTYSEENYHSVYTHKFTDMDISKVLHEAWKQGIHCFAVFGKCNQYDDL